MHASLVMQSADTIASGQHELTHYHTILEVRESLFYHIS